MSENNMKKTISKEQADDAMQSEYDFSGGVRGKYAKQLKENGYTIRIYHRDGTFSERHVLGEKTIVLKENKMSEQIAKLLVKIEAGNMDDNELEDLTSLLKEDIAIQDVKSVEHVKGGDVPEGAMAVEWLKEGSFMIKLTKGLINPVITTIDSWLKRRANQIEVSSETNLNIKVCIGSLSFEINKSTSNTENIIKDLEQQASA